MFLQSEIIPYRIRIKDNMWFNKQRWQIETMFKAFKTQGFNIEDTHLSDIGRIDKLVAVVSFAFT